MCPNVQILEGDCIEVMASMDENSIDAICTDPPYGLEFMGKEWDKLAPAKTSANRGSRMGEPDPRPWSRRERVSFGGDNGRRNEKCLKCDKWRVSSNRCQCDAPEWDYRPRQAAPPSQLAMQQWHEAWAREAFRVLKPGGHMLAFGGTRTVHRLTCAIEDAGFEIRDTIQWIYGSGFPKSKNVGNGWGTALKPAHEPIVLARKPLSQSSVARQVLATGTGALNVDGCRVGHDDDLSRYERSETSALGYHGVDKPTLTPSHPSGRWPANLLLSHHPDCNGECVGGCPVRLMDEQSGQLKSGALDRSKITAENKTYGKAPKERTGSYQPNEGGASRFFYVAKASRRERGEGNNHPTVKPVALMRYLCKLITPPGGTVLDPFIGSGSTGCAAVQEGFNFIGIEKEEEYAEIARRRIAYWSQPEELRAKQTIQRSPSQGYKFAGNRKIAKCPEHGETFLSGEMHYKCGCPFQWGKVEEPSAAEQVDTLF